MNHNKSYESEFNKSGEIRDNSEKIEPISVWSVIEELNAEAEKKYDDFMSHNVNELNKILNQRCSKAYNARNDRKTGFIENLGILARSPSRSYNCQWPKNCNR